MSPNFWKAIMVRSKLRNKYLKQKREISRRAYGKQRNYCVKPFKKN